MMSWPRHAFHTYFLLLAAAFFADFGLDLQVGRLSASAAASKSAVLLLCCAVRTSSGSSMECTTASSAYLCTRLNLRLSAAVRQIDTGKMCPSRKRLRNSRPRSDCTLSRAGFARAESRFVLRLRFAFPLKVPVWANLGIR